VVAIFSKIGTVQAKIGTILTKISIVYPKFNKKSELAMPDFFNPPNF
jgi:hypothetical protein